MFPVLKPFAETMAPAIRSSSDWPMPSTQAASRTMTTKKNEAKSSKKPVMLDSAHAIRVAVGQCLTQVARSPDQEKTFPVGPDSAKKLGSAHGGVLR